MMVLKNQENTNKEENIHRSRPLDPSEAEAGDSEARLHAAVQP